MLRHDAERALLPSPADQHRQALLDRVGEQPQVIDRIVPGRGHALAVEQPPDDVRGLVEPADPLTGAGAELQPVGTMLALEPARTEPEDRRDRR